MKQEQIKQIYDDPKAFLLQGKKAKELMTAKRERVDSWRRRVSSITAAVKPDGGSVPSAYKQSLVENAVCAITDLENEILSEIEALACIERDIQEAISLFIEDDRHKAVLELRYLNGYSWRSIGSRLYYGEDWVCRLHGSALQEMRKNAERALHTRE